VKEKQVHNSFGWIKLFYGSNHNTLINLFLNLKFKRLQLLKISFRSKFVLPEKSKTFPKYFKFYI